MRAQVRRPKLVHYLHCFQHHFIRLKLPLYLGLPMFQHLLENEPMWSEQLPQSSSHSSLVNQERALLFDLKLPTLRHQCPLVRLLVL